LKSNIILTELNLFGNSIGDVGALAISESLRTNSVLTSLDLGCNPIGDETKDALFASWGPRKRDSLIFF